MMCKLSKFVTSRSKIDVIGRMLLLRPLASKSTKCRRTIQGSPSSQSLYTTKPLHSSILLDSLTNHYLNQLQITYHKMSSSEGIKQSQLHDTTSSGTSTVTTDGSVVQSSDPSTKPDASIAQKLKGDAAGMAKGATGSLQAAAGATIRNKEMEQKGLDKMSEEDERLGAKRGVMPVGSGQRETKEPAI